jgi:hypothetical protein
MTMAQNGVAEIGGRGRDGWPPVAFEPDRWWQRLAPARLPA